MGSGASKPRRPGSAGSITRETYHNTHSALNPPTYRYRYVASYGDKLSKDPKKKDNVLQVEKVDYNIRQNTPRHNTDLFEITQDDETPDPQLVVRRGTPFDITLTFNKPYDKNNDDLRLVFETGDKPLPNKKTHVEFVLSDEDKPKEWGGKVKRQDRNNLEITIFTPPTCYVAKWDFKVDVVKKSDTKSSIFRYTHKDPIYILFNPFSKEDTVYKETDLKEYILNENGRIYSGTYKNISPKPWNFGQFQGKVLDCVMHLLDISGLNWVCRGNPIQVVRKLTSMINAPDDGGVLVGNWSGDYRGGKSPLTWTGSEAIFEEYYNTDRPVKFGQCWVFSGVLTTACRALGIPARSVTNFASAHDTDGSVSIDIHFDHLGEPDETKNSDSVWNFHVWNEVWMARNDLPTGYGGWQAADATPQETSDGVYCCGPASLEAVKNGELAYAFDGPFIFAEVNADKIYWTTELDGTMINNHTEKKSVGRKISTKYPLRPEREDVTHLYKYAEGSEEERTAVLRANQTGSCRHDIYAMGPQDVEFELEQQDDVYVGQDFDVIFKIKNTSRNTERYITGRLSCRSMYYTGVGADKIKTDTFELFVPPGEVREQKLHIEADEYMNKLKDMCMLKFSAMAKVQGTEQVFTTQEDFRLCKPSLVVKVPNEIKKGKSFDVEVSFTNPLGESMTECYLEVEGPGLLKRKQYPQRNVKPKQTFVTKFELTPKKLGEKEILVMFNSKQLEDVTATTVVNVKN
ncbi:hypothetical protein LOTGIDRAFT_231723 [Lottia gigantea]|uniref:protein-glutamine gamma-glutamyltransferase n=1 Tax=Lottia gigantea TaxID=225164 RepID=V3ZZF9_LOTGI|nr:hypothetical protein LOTGIDRAFT_231723 [Lottia gigantea]ESO96923.1 hypothetical protein LOTGIDRAFT_231723 [Lottia gigantea]